MVTFCIESSGSFFYVQEIEYLEDINATLYKGNRIRYERPFIGSGIRYDANSITIRIQLCI